MALVIQNQGQRLGQFLIQVDKSWRCMSDRAKPVVVVDYDPHWQRMFEDERARILTVLGSRVAAIEHIGSTAVVGLGAKPIADIMIGLRALADTEPCISRLTSIGYNYRPENEHMFPERRFLDRPSYHLHMVEVSSDFWRRHIMFRDYLRIRPEKARQYLELKKELASKYQVDREGYTDAKTRFIAAALEEAGYVPIVKDTNG
jgi:GrpB-like predicted nucleotidyltransferase (UPF0157 family)